MSLARAERTTANGWVTKIDKSGAAGNETSGPDDTMDRQMIGYGLALTMRPVEPIVLFRGLYRFLSALIKVSAKRDYSIIP